MEVTVGIKKYTLCSSVFEDLTCYVTMSYLSFLSTRDKHHWSPELTWGPPCCLHTPTVGTNYIISL